MKFSATFILLFLTSFLNVQNTPNNLIGTWECYHIELEDGSTKSIDLLSGGEEYEYSCDGFTLEFNEDFTGKESMNGLNFNFKYQQKDSILRLGNREYIIEMLTKRELIIRNYDSKGISLMGHRKKYRRVN